VTDIAQKDKNEAKRTKPSTRMERVHEIKAEGVFIFNGPTRWAYGQYQLVKNKMELVDQLLESLFALGTKCMQTRSSSKFVGEPFTNPTSTNPKRRNRSCSKQRVEPFALEETPVVKINVNSSEIASTVTSDMTAMFKQHQVTLAPASVKAVEESCVTCGGAHSYRQYPATDGNTFSGYQDNIQGYVSATAVK
ncbi:hypothetical protein Tco_1265923, partial [Tanacetum coccineum]